jgi:hypothetical protein
MKNLLIQIIFVLLFFSCKNEQPKTETKVYIGFVPSTFTGKEKIIDTLEGLQYLSEDFWKFLILKYPYTSSIIFNPFYKFNSDFITLKDTSLIINTGDFDTFSQLGEYLPENGDDGEVLSVSRPQATPFIGSMDETIEMKKIKIPAFSIFVKKDYESFKRLMLDKKRKPIFVFSNTFLKEIEEICN